MARTKLQLTDEQLWALRFWFPEAKDKREMQVLRVTRSRRKNTEQTHLRVVMAKPEGVILYLNTLTLAVSEVPA